MDRISLIQIFYKDLNRYRNWYRYVGISNKLSILTIVVLFSASSFLPPSNWVTIYQAAALVLYLVSNVVNPSKYKQELKKRIHDLFEIVTRLSKAQITKEEWEDTINDIMEKGLLLEVQSQASIKLINQSNALTHSRIPVEFTEGSSLDVSSANTE